MQDPHQTTLMEWLEASRKAADAARRGAGYGPIPADMRAGATGALVLREMMDGVLPVPKSCEKNNYFLASFTIGAAVVQGYAGPDDLNPGGSAPGGWMAMLLASAMASAVMSALPAGYGALTTGINVDYRAVLPPRRLVRAAAAINGDEARGLAFEMLNGRRVKVGARATLRGVGGDVYADAVAVFRVFRTEARS